MKMPILPKNTKKPEGCLVILLVPILFLFSCASAKKASDSFTPLNIYQPPIIILPAAKSVVTEEGIYTPQTREVWHSDARYRELERKIYN